MTKQQHSSSSSSNSQKKTSWDVLLIGGPSGVGKTCASYPLARHFDVGITEVDDLHIVLETMTTPQQQPVLHYWSTKPESEHLSAEQILDHHIAVGRIMMPAIEGVIANHVETKTPIILDGDYILPELVAPNGKLNLQDGGRVSVIFLYEPDQQQIIKNYAAREPEEGEQLGRAHVSWLYGQWLAKECEKFGIPILPARPWDSLLDRIIKAIE